MDTKATLFLFVLGVLGVLGVLCSLGIMRAVRLVLAEVRAAREDARRARALSILDAFTPAIAQAQSDPRALVVWEPLARAARTLMPDEFAALDRATGGRFPFSPERVQAAHAQWTADWLAWERAHDFEYKRKAAEAERRSGDAADTRAAVESIEREKLDRYQRRYEEYIRIAKALQALTP